MEIRTEPSPPASTPWGRLLLFGVLFGPVTLLVLLPIGLGFERYVMTGDSMAGSIGRGSIAFERVVPVSDLQIGDVITYPTPDSADGDGGDGGDGGDMVTHRIVYVGPQGIVTRGDAEPAADPWTYRPTSSTVSRVEFTVPWVGWAYLLLFHPPGWTVVLAAAIALVALTRRPGRTRPDRSLAGGPVATLPVPVPAAASAPGSTAREVNHE